MQDPLVWTGQTKPQNPVLFHVELCCRPCYMLEQLMGLPGFLTCKTTQ